MKVITEERLADIFATRFINEETQQLLINECQELNTLTVTRLRPMSDAPRNGVSFLTATKLNNCMVKAYWCDGHRAFYIYDYGQAFHEYELEGFIPMPRYEPEKV